MNVSYNIDKDKNLIYIKFSGLITEQELMTTFAKMNEDPIFDKGINVIMDAMKVKTNLNIKDIRKIITYLKHIQKEREKIKLAIVAPGNATYGISREFESLWHEQAIELRVFRDLGKARNWVTN